jgi:hypothetical protein
MTISLEESVCAKRSTSPFAISVYRLAELAFAALPDHAD